MRIAFGDGEDKHRVTGDAEGDRERGIGLGAAGRGEWKSVSPLYVRRLRGSRRLAAGEIRDWLPPGAPRLDDFLD